MKYKVPKIPVNSWQFHVAFWLIYWGIASLQDVFFHSHFRENYNLPIVLGAIGIVYVNYYYWLPKYLIERKRYLFYSFSLAGMIALNSWLVNIIVGTLFIQKEFYFSWQASFIMAVDTTVIVGFTTAFKFIQQWNDRNAYAKELERKNLESELEMLKSQMNPHFIFNTLNTIYFLMEQRDDKAKEVLLKFSNILSHQLYDYSKELIDLSKEVEYLENYIELQKLRHDEDLLTLKYSLPQEVNAYKIAPMLIIPFIENAFKYSPNSKGYLVEFHLKVAENGALHFSTQNSISATVRKKEGIGGMV
jgi:LytS/YehU family sensor histidine kinase